MSAVQRRRGQAATQGQASTRWESAGPFAAALAQTDPAAVLAHARARGEALGAVARPGPRRTKAPADRQQTRC